MSASDSGVVASKGRARTVAAASTFLARHGAFLVILFVLSSLATAAAIWWYYTRQREDLEAAAGRELLAVAEAETAQIANWRQERIGDARVASSSAMIRIAGRVLASNVPAKADRDDLRDVMKRLMGEFGYTNVVLVDRNGVVRVQAGREPPIDDQTNNAFRAKLFQQAEGTRDAVLSDINGEPHSGRPLMTLTVPVHDAGALILYIDPWAFLYPYLRSWPGVSRTGETLLARRDGDTILYLSSRRYSTGAPLRASRSVREMDVPTDAQVESGWLFRGKDYRGVKVLAAVKRVPSSPWFLLAKADAAEVDAPVRRLGLEVAVMMALIALADAAGVGLIWKSRQLRLDHESEERFRAIANDTPACLWMVSPPDNGVLVNATLATFLGTSDQRALRRWIAHVHPDDRDRVTKRVRECTRARSYYSDEFRLLRADGEYRSVISQGTPRLSPEGKFLGYAGAVLDTADRRSAEEKLRAANSLLSAELAERTQQERQIRALSARLIDAQEEERSRLSRELHDDLSQQIAALSISLGNLKRRLPEHQEEERNQTDWIQDKLVALSEKVRRISHELHPAILQYSGLAAALRGHCEEFQASTGIGVTLKTVGEFDGLSSSVALSAFRIAQEALRNVAKHSKAEAAEVELVRSGGEVRLTVSDRGIGMDEERLRAGIGLGLTSIRERSRLVNGTVDLQSFPLRGTKLTVRIPDQAEQPPHSAREPVQSDDR